MTSVTDLLPASCFDELDEWAGNDEVKVGVVQILKQVKELCESRAKKIQEENKKLKELKELYEGRAKGMEEELNKIEKLVGIKEGDIPKPNQVFNAVNKLKEENKEYEFESCESLISTQKLYGQAFAIQSERDALREENKKLKELVGSIKKETDKAK